MPRPVRPWISDPAPPGGGLACREGKRRLEGLFLKHLGLEVVGGGESEASGKEPRVRAREESQIHVPLTGLEADGAFD